MASSYHHGLIRSVDLKTKHRTGGLSRSQRTQGHRIHTHVMSTTATDRMGSAVVVGMAAGGCNDARRATRSTTTNTTTGGVNGNGEGISSVSVRRATLSDACSMTNLVNDAHRHSTLLFAAEGSTRVAPDGTQGTRAIVFVQYWYAIRIMHPSTGILLHVRIDAWIQT